ncbi:hypothetical protein RBLE17_03910 [Rhodobacteraceae bacterium LE17]|nr:hypothetical protein [Rhodobacteraceae bacterium LE17]
MPIWGSRMIDHMKFMGGCVMQAAHHTGAEA